MAAKHHNLAPGTAKDLTHYAVSGKGITSAAPPSRSRVEIGLFAALALAVCATAISAQSYWIDEAVNVYRATLPTLPDLWRFLRAEGNANLQVPLYYLFSWAWEKVTGPNEFSMRAGNAVWFLLGLTVLLKAFKGHRDLRFGIAAAFLISPFAWYYLDEARPYTLQLSTSLVVFAALFRLSFTENDPSQERRWIVVLCAASVLLAASGLLAMLWLGSYLGGALLSTGPTYWKKLVRNHWQMLASTLLLLFLMGLYYLWTLTLGARASGGNMDAKTAMFIPYELLGFSGLGPGRIILREKGIAALRDWLPLIAVYAALLLFVLVTGWRRLCSLTSLRTRVSWGVAFGLVAGFIFSIGMAVKFRVLGRHCMPLLPLVLLVVGCGLGAQLKRDGWVGRILVIVFVGLNLASSLSLRYAARHRKDDYRSAAAMARAALARGEVVWWNAAKDGALVYHLPVNEAAGPNTALYLMNPSPAVVHDLPHPDLILASKPDLYDQEGTLKNYVTTAGFRPCATFTAFTAWRAQPKP